MLLHSVYDPTTGEEIELSEDLIQQIKKIQVRLAASIDACMIAFMADVETRTHRHTQTQTQTQTHTHT